MNEISIATIGFGLVLIGFVLALIAVILLATRSANAGTKTRGGGILLIGPIPIIFGTDRESVKILVILIHNSHSRRPHCINIPCPVNHMSPPLCPICEMRPATHVCQDCGRVACSNCIDPIHLVCSECQAKLRPPSPPASSATSPIPFGDVAIFHSFRRNFHRHAADNFRFSLKLWPV